MVTCIYECVGGEARGREVGGVVDEWQTSLTLCDEDGRTGTDDRWPVRDVRT